MLELSVLSLFVPRGTKVGTDVNVRIGIDKVFVNPACTSGFGDHGGKV